MTDSTVNADILFENGYRKMCACQGYGTAGTAFCDCSADVVHNGMPYKASHVSGVLHPEEAHWARRHLVAGHSIAIVGDSVFTADSFGPDYLNVFELGYRAADALASGFQVEDALCDRQVEYARLCESWTFGEA